LLLLKLAASYTSINIIFYRDLVYIFLKI
jgi:hypothetical protein